MKKIREIVGLNVANIERQRISIGENSTGIQWGNGFGKSFIIIQYIINCSTRLDYSLKNTSTANTKETDFLASFSLNANGKDIVKQEDKANNIYNKLRNLFNENERKNAHSFTGLYMVDDENKEFYLTITYPTSSDITKLTRTHFLFKDEKSFDVVYDYICNETTIKQKILTKVLSEIQSSIVSKEIIKLETEENNKQERSSVYLSDKSPFYLGYKNILDSSIDIIIAVGQKETEVVENGLVLRSIEKCFDKNEDDIETFFKCGNIIDKLKQYLDIKKINLDKLSLMKKEISEFSNFDVLHNYNLLKTQHYTFEEKKEKFKNEYETKKDIITKKEEELNKSLERQKNDKYVISNKNNDNEKSSKEFIKLLNLKDNTIIDFNKFKEEKGINLNSNINDTIFDFQNRKKELELKKDIGYIQKLNKDVDDKKRLLNSYKDELSNKNKKFKINSDNIDKIKNKKETLFGNQDNNKLMDFYLYKLDKTTIFIDNFDKKDISDAIEIFKKMEDTNNSIFQPNNTMMKEYENFLQDKKEETLEDLEYQNEQLEKEIIMIKDNIITLEKELKKDTELLENSKNDVINIDNLILNNNLILDTLQKIQVNFIKTNEENLKEKITPEIVEELNKIPDLNFNDYCQKTIEMFEINKENYNKINNELISFIVNIEKDLSNLKIEKEELEKINKYVQRYNQTNINKLINDNDFFDEIYIPNEIFKDMSLEELDNEIIVTFDEIININSNILNIINNHQREDYVQNNKDIKDLIVDLNFNNNFNLNNFSQYMKINEKLEETLSITKNISTTLFVEFYDVFEKFETSLEKFNKFIVSDLKKQFRELTNYKSNSGHKYELHKENFYELHPIEEEYFNSFNSVFKSEKTSYLEQHNIERLLNEAEVSDIIRLKTSLEKINEIYISKNEKDSFSEFIKNKTKNFKLDTGETSTGNKMVLASKLRDLSLNKNQYFSSLLFLDEIANIDLKNIEILRDINVKNTVILGNQGFDGLRNFLDVMNIRTEVKEINGRKFYHNNSVWNKKD